MRAQRCALQARGRDTIRRCGLLWALYERSAMPDLIAVHCDRCGADDKQLEPVVANGRMTWHYCPTCKADYLGYEEGRRHVALEAFERATNAALEEGFTHYQLRKALELRLHE